MSATTTAPSVFRSSLARLRLRLWAWLILRGLAWTVPLTAAVLLTDALLDWAIRFDVYQRAVMLALMGVAVVGLVGWFLIRPLLARLSDAGLLAEIERTAGVGRGRLRTAAELAAAPPAGPLASPALVERLIAEGVSALDAGFRRPLLDRRGLATSGLVLSLTVLLVGGLSAAAARSGLLGIWFDRNIALGESLWPQNTYLAFLGQAEDGAIVVPRGEDVTLAVVVRETSLLSPSEVRLEFRPAAGRPSRIMRRESDAFRLTIPPITPPLEVRAIGGDAVTAWIPVRLVEQPDAATLHLAVTPPAYTGQNEATPLPPGSGPYTLLRGSGLAVTGQTNKPVTTGRLELSHPRADGWTTWRTVAFSEPMPPPRGAVPADGSARDTDPAPASETADTGQAFMTELTPDDWGRLENVLGSGRDFKLRLVFEDELGLTTRSPRAVGFRIREDAPPRVTAETPGIAALVVPTARIPVSASATDDLGLTAMRIAWRVRGETEADDRSGLIPLSFDPFRNRENDPSGEASVSDDRSTRFPTAGTARQLWELAELNLPVGRRLSFFVEALDNDTLHGPGVGRSREFLVEIVTEDQLRADLLRREREMREAFEALVKGERDLATETRALAASWEVPEAAVDEAASSDLAQTQRTIARNVEALAQKFADVLLEIDNNKLEAADGPLHNRLRDQVIGPMVEIAGPMAGEAGRRLDVATRLASRRAAGLDAEAERSETDTGETPANASPDNENGNAGVAVTKPADALAQAAEQIDRLVAAMDEVLFHMVKAEGYQEAVGLLMEIEKQQSGVLERTRAADRDRIRRILEGGPRPTAPRSSDSDRPAP